MVFVNFKGDDKTVIIFLTNFYKGKDINNKNKIKYTKLNYNKVLINNLGNYINSNIKNIIFRATICAYGQTLEKEVSLNKKNIKQVNLKLFYAIYMDYTKYNTIRPSLLNKINYTEILTKHKNGDKNNLNNYRFLFNHSTYGKLLDKLWTLDLLKKIEKNPYYSVFNRGDFKCYIKEVAKEVTDKKDNIILLDLKKAFDSVEWINFEKLLKPSLIRRIGNDGIKLYYQYINFIQNRRCYYKKNLINIKKGIPTGLPSSSVIFTLILDELLYKFFKINYSEKDYKKDFKLYVYMDDIAIHIKNKNKIKKIINSLENIFSYYKFTINKKKSLISKNISHNLIHYKIIKPDDYYLGLPFSRNKINYLQIILEQFKTRNVELNIIDYHDLYIKYKLYKKKIDGFFRYKIYGLGNYDFNDIIKKLI